MACVAIEMKLDFTDTKKSESRLKALRVLDLQAEVRGQDGKMMCQ
jgi:hypothetical protein